MAPRKSRTIARQATRPPFRNLTADADVSILAHLEKRKRPSTNIARNISSLSAITAGGVSSEFMDGWPQFHQDIAEITGNLLQSNLATFPDSNVW